MNRILEICFVTSLGNIRKFIMYHAFIYGNTYNNLCVF